MITGYVRKGERVLFGIALAFSLLVYGLIVLGVGAGIVAASSKQSLSEDLLNNYEEPDQGSEEYLDTTADEESIDSIDNDQLLDEDSYGTEDYGDSDLQMETAMASPVNFIGVAGIFIFYILLLVVIVVGAHILAVGHLMGNGIRVSENQFPELWKIFGRAALELGVKKLPAFYLVESGGLLNAFATRLFTRSYVAIYADLAERLYEGDEDSVAFVVAHELVHVKRNHMLRNLITLPAMLIPFLKSAWRRACEYSCDAGAALLSPNGAEKGLMLLAAGKKLSVRMDVEAYLQSFRAEKSFWKRLAEITASHPHLPKRIQALRNRQGQGVAT